MDSDQWISRLAAAKRRYSLQHHQSSQLGFDFLRFCFDLNVFDWVGFGWFEKELIFDRLLILDRLGMDDFEVEEEIRPDFPCPYCHEDHDVTTLCTHFEDEHSLESKVAVRFDFFSFC